MRPVAEADRLITLYASKDALPADNGLDQRITPLTLPLSR